MVITLLCICICISLFNTYILIIHNKNKNSKDVIVNKEVKEHKEDDNEMIVVHSDRYDKENNDED